MADLKLTLPAAQLLSVEAQGLRQPLSRPAVKEDVLATIRRLGLLQIDTINIVARAPYLALFSRLGDYQPAWLDELLAEGRIFEYWAHAACFLPIEDYPYHRRIMLEGQRMYYRDGWYEQNRPAVDGVLAHVRANGAVRSADFEGEKRAGGWWNWKIEKNALEYWFSTGDLMVRRRENFQRVYDLRERVLPGWDDTRAPSPEEVYRKLVERTVHALGIARPAWVWDYFRLNKVKVAAAIKELAREGRLREVAVEGWEEPALLHPERIEQARAALDGGLEATHTTLLTPFDALISDRKRALQLFNFDYSIECYLPPAKRKYGYFALPLLHRGAFAGRLDAKAYRKEGFFEVKSLYLEEGVTPGEELAAAVAGAIRRCAAWHATPEVRLGRCTPEEFRLHVEPLL